MFRSTSTQSASQELPFSASSLPIEVWTKIYRRILRSDLHKCDSSDILPLLTACRSSKSLLTSLPEYKYLRTVITRMKCTTYSTKHNLFTVAQYTEAPYRVSGKAVAILNHRSSRETDDGLRRDMVETELKSLRESRARFFGIDDGIKIYPDTLQADTCIKACYDLIQSEPAEDDNIADIRRSLKHLEAITFRHSTTHYLPAVPREHTTVLIAASRRVNSSDYASWFDKDCLWKGSAEYLYWLCKEGRDLEVPERRVNRKHHDTKEMRLLCKNFVKWYERRPCKKRISFKTDLWVPLHRMASWEDSENDSNHELEGDPDVVGNNGDVVLVDNSDDEFGEVSVHSDDDSQDSSDAADYFVDDVEEFGVDFDLADSWFVHS
ncbi:hypothetical protein HK097_000548 [Rhizophlyctis rosea]|uniref:F-box domain-containing protein n=1 Tax=Rhizophlyctis rosea TaxID=64517 RepID=A0AAD5SKG5_9FUNG|nr:hypothetical protein HK097_000548 [Rhizophlyctis rosea]